MNAFNDRLLLLISAIGLGALMLSGTFVLVNLGFSEQWDTLWPYTVLLFLVLLVAGANEITRRAKKLHRKWPLVAVVVAVFIAHCLVLGWLLRGISREWRLPHFYLLSVGETILFGLIFEQVYGRCVRPAKQMTQSIDLRCFRAWQHNPIEGTSKGDDES